jgi:hypothetical protein
MRFLVAALFTTIVAGPPAVAGLGSPVASACTITGENILLGGDPDSDVDIRVRPAGGDAFRLTSLRAAKIAANPAERPRGRTIIEVHDVLSFSATTGSLSYRVSRPLETSQGMVKLAAGATFSQVVAAGGAVRGELELRGRSEIVPSVEIPCDALTLNVPPERPDNRLIVGDGTWWRPKGDPRRFTLRAGPDAGAARLVLTVRDSTTDSDRLFFERIEQRGTWIRVAHEGFLAVVTGWVPATAVVAVPDAPSGTGCCYGSTTGAGYSGEGRRAKPYFYEGPAHITVGATIFADRGTGAWAKVEKDGLFKIRYDEGDTWAQITGIPGLGGAQIPAYVSVAATRPEHSVSATPAR